MDFMVILLIAGGLVALVFGGNFLVEGASDLAKAFGIPSLVIGLTIVAFGTSSPELAVSVNAALSGNADIAIANIVGSNILNILFILGICSLIVPLTIHTQIIKRELPILILTSVTFFVLSINSQLSWLESLFLLAGAIGYTSWLVYEAIQNKQQNRELESGLNSQACENNNNLVTPSIFRLYIKPTIWIALGLVAISFGADWLVSGAIQIAHKVGVSQAIIGATIVAAGTSLPEVSASVIASIKGERDIAVGNVIGSNIYNILGILGIAGALVPDGLTVSNELLKYHYPVMLAAALLCLPFFRPGATLKKPTGMLFLFGYLGYTLFLIYQTI